MTKSLLYRLFGFGALPKAMRPVLEGEGIELLEEGVSGSVRFRNFRAPGKRYGYRRAGMVGSLAVTRIRFIAFQWSTPIVNLPLEGPFLAKLQCTLPDATTLGIGFEASDFDANQSGTIEVRFVTPKAALFHERLAA